MPRRRASSKSSCVAGLGISRLEPGVELRFVLDPPVREERGEGAFGENDEIAASGAGVTHLVHEPGNDLSFSRFVAKWGRFGPRRW